MHKCMVLMAVAVGTSCKTHGESIPRLLTCQFVCKDRFFSGCLIGKMLAKPRKPSFHVPPTQPLRACRSDLSCHSKQLAAYRIRQESDCSSSLEDCFKVRQALARISANVRAVERSSFSTHHGDNQLKFIHGGDHSKWHPDATIVF
jgi:hypothetical protein